MPNNIGDAIKVPQSELWKEYLFVQYDQKNNTNLLPLPIPVKSPIKGKKVLRSLMVPGIKQVCFYDSCKFVEYHCPNEISKVKGIDFCHYFIPIVHA